MKGILGKELKPVHDWGSRTHRQAGKLGEAREGGAREEILEGASEEPPRKTFSSGPKREEQPWSRDSRAGAEQHRQDKKQSKGHVLCVLVPWRAGLTRRWAEEWRGWQRQRAVRADQRRRHGVPWGTRLAAAR